MQLTASILGWFVVAGLLLSGANYFFKLIGSRWIGKLPKDALMRRNYQSFLRWYLRFHPLIGSLTAHVLIVHFILQYLNWGFFVSGMIAGSLLILETALGLYGNFVKHKKRGLWLYAHRTVAVLLVLSVAFHVFTAISIAW
ncbi:MAG: hypothetical protein ACYCYM_14835 [Saccharofermentanales bacterium]